MTKKLKSQPRIPGMIRESALACIDPLIKRELEKDALRHGVSKSWVQAVILANHYKIKIPGYR